MPGILRKTMPSHPDAAEAKSASRRREAARARRDKHTGRGMAGRGGGVKGGRAFRLGGLVNTREFLRRGRDPLTQITQASDY